MKQIYITDDFDGTLALNDNAHVPSITSNEVLIKVSAAGVNRADLFQADGLYPAPEGISSTVPGLEVAGTIMDIGSDVNTFSIRDSVCALLPGGGYSEYVAADSSVTLPIPKGFNFMEAASLPEALFTTWLALKYKADIQKGDHILIHCGASGVGSFAIQLAQALGCQVSATASTSEKCQFLRTLGADPVFNYRHDDAWLKSLKEEFGPIDVILDPLGGAYAQPNLSLLGYGGRYVSIAILDGKISEINLASILMKNISFYGMTLRSQPIAVKKCISQDLYSHVWPLLENHSITPHIDSHFTISQAQKAHDLLRQNKHKGKVILRFD